MKENRPSKLSFENLSVGALIAILMTFLLSNCQSVPTEIVVTTTSSTITQSPIPKVLEVNPTQTSIPTQIDPTMTPLTNTPALNSSQTPKTSSPVIERKLQWSVKAVLDVNWSPNSERFVAILEKTTDVFGIQLYDVHNEREIWFVEDNADSVVFNPIGDSIITTSTFYGLREFDATDGTVKKDIDDPYNCLGGHEIAITQDGKTVYSGYSPFVRGSTPHTSTIYQWDLDTGQCLGEILFKDGWLRSLLISPDNQYLVTVFSHLQTNNDIETIVWKITTQDEICSIGGVVPAFEPNGDLYISSESHEGELDFWNVADCTLSQTLNIDHSPDSIAISPDGKLIVTGGSSIKIWERSSGNLVHEQKNIPNEVQQLAFSPNGKYLISVHPAKSLDGTTSIILWTVR